MRTMTWLPLMPKDIFRLTESVRGQLVQSVTDLCDLLVDVLRNYEMQLHGEQNPVRALWDRQKSGRMFRPKEEDGVSDDLKRFLQRELVERGIVANPHFSQRRAEWGWLVSGWTGLGCRRRGDVAGAIVAERRHRRQLGSVVVMTVG